MIDRRKERKPAGIEQVEAKIVCDVETRSLIARPQPRDAPVVHIDRHHRDIIIISTTTTTS
jgi:hypothetical protein